VRSAALTRSASPPSVSVAMDSTSFIKIEEKFTAKLPPSQKILCCKPATAVTIICVLLILSNINYFMTLPFRWGKPCFFWWEHWATIVTFVSTTAIRVAVLPLAVLALLDHQKKGTQWLQILFHAMLGLSAVFALDAFLCVFEVNEVCESGAMKQFQDCASDWGRWAADAPLHVNKSAIEGGFRCPESCKTDTYDFQYVSHWQTSYFSASSRVCARPADALIAGLHMQRWQRLG
jgi:hypothetical protein